MNVLRRIAGGAGVVTTSYPDVEEPAPLAYRGQVLLRTDRCSGDGACARICPSAAIAVSDTSDGGWTWELDDGRCVFCGLCAEVCPTAAIMLSSEFELSVRDRAELMVRATFTGRASQTPNGKERS
jgi:formate hydrogenlyase subunit 6/NADH:ubiquinone oxidoreductase subunit I